ncbi:GTP cyclohydrolase 1 type 2/Nif3 [Triangularia setosa]|uniref:GTP cyclohydrolase 1 type 2/Nif3 n=1 Tax=Triangularia setosa TaxID=2587417 RepID=A0AAN6WD63_9PEZI|nr:GTP cyclohydrolase 1 type 2/Nif3 [Podospora setosa]
MNLTSALLRTSPRLISSFASQIPQRTFAMATMRSPLFTQQVVKAMQTLYPEPLADRAWDNVGLLQENFTSSASTTPTPPVVILTNDLTLSVAQEAISRNASVIISYHPFIFRGLKSITLADPQQRIVLLLAQHNIAVYSPHTAIDAAPGGMADWLASMLSSIPGVTTTVSTVTPVDTSSLGEKFAGAGYGRKVQLSKPVGLGELVTLYAKGLGGLRHVMVARPKTKEQIRIKTVAVCPGSGESVLAGVKDADLIVTGEMSHHPALKLVMEEKSVLSVFHSNSERAFLREVLKPQLEEQLKEVNGVQVLVSEEDQDPFQIVDVEDLPEDMKEDKMQTV